MYILIGNAWPYANGHNSELLGAYGNFVNRSLVFIQKSFEGKVPEAGSNTTTKQTIIPLYSRVGLLIEHGDFKEALDEILAFVRWSNKYFDEKQPWITVKSDLEKCRETLNTCIQIIANLSILLEPFLPFSSTSVKTMLGIEETTWQYTEVTSGFKLEPVKLLFERIDKKVITEEEARLQGNYID